MRSRRACRAAFLAAILFALPIAAAHGGPPPREYDPLDLDLHGHLAPGGAITENAPAAGAAHFAARSPSSDALPLDFTRTAPVAFLPVRGLSLGIFFATDAPLAPNDAGGRAVTLVLLHNGEPIESSETSIALPSLMMPTGAPQKVELTLQAPGSVFEKGDTLGVRLLARAPVLSEGSLKVVLGESSAHLEAIRVPTVADLEHGNDGLAVFNLVDSDFRPKDPGAIVHDVRVSHANVDGASGRQPIGTKVFVVFRGVHSVAEAYEHHHYPDAERRNAAAHEFFVGDTRVLVHPGLGVVVPVERDAPGLVELRCGANCPTPGWTAVLNFTLPEDVRPGPGQAGSIIPPPRDTTGVAVSPDAPEKKGVPLPGLLAVGALLVVAACFRRR